MKIAFIIDTCAPFYRGGYETRAWEIARELARVNDVHIFTSVAQDCQREGVRFRRVRAPVAYFKSDGFRSLRQNLWFATALLRLIWKKETFDVIDCNATPFVHVWIARILAIRWHAGFVVTAHEALAGTMVPYFRARGVWAPSAIGSLCKCIYLLTHRLAQATITPTTRMAAELRREGCKNVFSVPGGVAFVSCRKHYHSRELNRQIRIGYFGRVVRNKRVEKVLSAFNLAIQRGLQGRLIVLGSGTEVPALRQLARDLQIDTLTDFVETLSEDEKLRYLAERIDVFASASYREGFCLAALEAMAAGNPTVLASKPERFSSGVLEFAADGQNALITDGEAPSLAGAFLQLQRDPAMYDRLSAEAVETAARYNWHAAAAAVLDVYTAVIGTDRDGSRRRIATARRGDAHDAIADGGASR